MVEVYAIRIDEAVDDESYRRLLSFVSDEKYSRISRFHFIQDAKRTLYGDVLIRYIACQKKQVTNKELVFTQNKYGKPFLRNLNSFHYNISHSGNWVVCAVSNKQVGIDIEEMKPIDIDIAKRFFSDSEYKDLILNHKDQISYFYDLWTLKESYIKYRGKGLSIHLDSFNFTITKGDIILTPRLNYPLYFKQVEFQSGYKLSICSEESMFLSNVQIIDIHVIIKCFYRELYI